MNFTQQMDSQDKCNAKLPFFFKLLLGCFCCYLPNTERHLYNYQKTILYFGFIFCKYIRYSVSMSDVIWYFNHSKYFCYLKDKTAKRKKRAVSLQFTAHTEKKNIIWSSNYLNFDRIKKRSCIQTYPNCIQTVCSLWFTSWNVYIG